MCNECILATCLTVQGTARRLDLECLHSISKQLVISLTSCLGAGFFLKPQLTYMYVLTHVYTIKIFTLSMSDQYMSSDMNCILKL
jgi:hypothetical protein